MTHIDLGSALPGLPGLLRFRPETAEPLTALAETLLCGPSTLTRGERELIAAVVSQGNECRFCAESHGAVAARDLPGGHAEVARAAVSPMDTSISDKLRALLHIASKVRISGRSVHPEDVAEAREAGATDLEIHDTVLIAAAFCMFNRYVDGLDTAPNGLGDHTSMADHIAEHGYLRT